MSTIIIFISGIVVGFFIEQIVEILSSLFIQKEQKQRRKNNWIIRKQLKKDLYKMR